MRGNTMAGAGFVLMWSSGFVGATLGTATAPAATLLMWRFLAATLLIGGWWWLTRRHRLTARQIGAHAGIGLLAQGGFLVGVVYSAELGVPAGIAALVAALQPIVAAALGGPLLGERSTSVQWIGLVVGLAGVALVVGGDLTGGTAPPLAYALPFGAMLSLVVATFAERRTRAELPLGDSLMVQCATSAVLFTAIALATGTVAPPVNGTFWFAVAWVVVLSTFGGYGCYWLVAQRSGVTRVSTLLYLTPPTTMLLAWLMFGQGLTMFGLLGLVVCLGAVLLVLRRPRSVPRRVSAPREMMAACSSPTSSPRPPTSPRPGRARPRSPSSPSC
ncbi:Permease of the drug/metabolite transporter (DMT) superfamily [Amycolatopsis arida]|uniref:Permease of the drug/metabolite transporter (DMT) superfamily n=1 Tax=Amycolatopsis arida TaxID=587909 RepID=A0A1I5PRJ6_9PSEU|nr:DMT family transporter [Amycolatopsis arida]TDX98584.1 drug/metabolite transporter (DMT)-like permease [Amycolatopsis arida]SFP36752.1 Permease of the drug/metabolite transporter (DMT) superfamily [Amycolatopsis arida]